MPQSRRMSQQKNCEKQMSGAQGFQRVQISGAAGREVTRHAADGKQRSRGR
jgi:hypothetical protein